MTSKPEQEEIPEEISSWIEVELTRRDLSTHKRDIARGMAVAMYRKMQSELTAARQEAADYRKTLEEIKETGTIVGLNEVWGTFCEVTEAAESAKKVLDKYNLQSPKQQ